MTTDRKPTLTAEQFISEIERLAPALTVYQRGRSYHVFVPGREAPYRVSTRDKLRTWVAGFQAAVESAVEES